MFISSSKTSVIKPALGIDWYHTINHRILLTKDSHRHNGILRISKSSVYSDDITEQFEIVEGGFNSLQLFNSNTE